ncbi:MAG: undecaprenyl-diphosphatase UppP [Hydrogenobaculum sp.]
MTIIHAIILGIVEGALEFLPVSAAGHLTLVGKLLGINTENPAFKIYEIFMQIGAVIAVIILYSKRLIIDKEIWLKIIAGFVPTGAIGFLFYKPIKHYLLGNPLITASMVFIGGVIIIIVESLSKKPKITSLKDVTIKDAIAVGFIQSLALIPGVSRSGATIIGAMLIGFERKTAADFSFLIAIPTMLSAGFYSLLKDHSQIHHQDILPMGISFITALIFAIVSVKTFLNFISFNNLKIFGYYRIITGLAYLTYLLR